MVDRVPPYPPEHTFGWIFEIQKVSEADVLRMVGLDAYIYLRFIVICFKMSVFVMFWGLVVLVPVYGTATTDPVNSWDHFAISNIMRGGQQSTRYRLWISALMGYVFAAYFCQLLYVEYNNFSVKRLQFLVQADPTQSLTLDPDTPPQTYFTVMVERIPGRLRNSQG
jgi:calcium permeable stress-gated cation channel